MVKLRNPPVFYKEGTAIAAMIAMITSTTINSVRVNPFFFVFFIYIPRLYAVFGIFVLLFII